MFRILFLVVIVSIFSLDAYCQSDTVSVDPITKPVAESNTESVLQPELESISEFELEPEAEPVVGFNPKPALMLGLGTFTFYGDTGNGLRSNSPFTSSAALNIGVGIPLRHNLDVSFSAIFSSLTLNEPGLSMANNFKSQINGGNVLFTYNFNDLLPSDAYVQPYIGTGISSFEFLSKADLYDGNGYEYHLWENGTIMSLPESSPNAYEAIMLERDYVYETDLRGLNEDGKGDYEDRTISIPLSLGVNFNLSKHIKGQLGTTMFFNFNDMIDNVGADDNNSDGRKDRFLHSSLSVSYDLFIPNKNKKHFDIELENEDPELMAIEVSDSDEDGVIDFEDECLGHPVGVTVDKRGCPVDSDEDGVADYKDDEPNTVKNGLVDEFGVTVDDQAYLDKYMFWIDSLQVQEWDEIYSRVDGEKVKETYSVLVLPQKGGMNQDEINTLLAEGDIKSAGENGEQGYLVGEFESLPDAVNKRIELQELGFSGAVHKEKDGEREDIDADLAGMTQIVSERNKSIGMPENTNEVIFRVQVGAFKSRISQNIFNNIDDLIVLEGDDGINRYMTQTYTDPSLAAKRKVELLTAGFEGSFITAYKNGKRVKLADSGFDVVEGGMDLLVDNENNSVTKSSVRFQVQLGEYADEIPTSVLEKFLEIGKVKPKKDESTTRYMLGDFETVEEAGAFLEIVKSKGLTDAQLKGVFDGKIISIEEAITIVGGNE